MASLFVVPCYVVVLRSAHHADIVATFETETQAIQQAYAWTTGADLVECTPPGLLFRAQYGDAGETVTVHRCTLELAMDDEDLDGWPCVDPADAAPRTRLRCVPRGGEETDA